MTTLRVIDAGTVPALRSQALWHGIADAMAPGDAPVLSFCRPGSAYVGIGYHRRLDELDPQGLREEGVAVIRRQIGGGPVWLDGDQLFYQLTLPLDRAPKGVTQLYDRLLEPATAAFRAMGVPAVLDGVNDIAVGRRRVSGTGAGQIGDAVTVVGNVIFRFPHDRMASVLALPSESMREEYLRLMRLHVSSLEAEGAGSITFATARAALQAAYAEAIAPARVSALTSVELASVERWEQRLADPRWTAGPELPARRARQVKVSASAWLVHGRRDGLEVLASVVAGVVDRARVTAPHLNGAAARLERALSGTRATREELEHRLAPLGAPGLSVLEALAPGLAVR